MFDLTDYVFTFQLPRWRIYRIGGRIRDLFATQVTLGVSTTAAVKKETLRVRRLWTARLKELAIRRLWFFYPGEPDSAESSAFDVNKFCLSYRRCVCCRPSFLFFKKSRRHAHRKINYQIRPCHRPLCPFCFARRADWQFFYVKRRINRWLTAGVTGIALTYRTKREFVPAVGFSPETGCSRDSVIAMARRLRLVVLEHQKAYRKLTNTKQLQRKTMGSLWRVVVIPTDGGWIVESQQFIAAKRGLKKLPAPELPRRTKGVYQRLAVSRDAKNYHAFNDSFYLFFGKFCRYPKELLTTHIELTAAVFWATKGLRLMAATGAFRGACLKSGACFKRLSASSFAVKNADLPRHENEQTFD